MHITRYTSAESGRDGVATCRYRYRESYCAHGSVNGRECLGEHRCAVITHERGAGIKQRDCARDQWFGLYCAKYQRFYCSGKDNCGTVESYLQHLNDFKQAQWRPQ